MALLIAVIGFILAGITSEIFWSGILGYFDKRDPKIIGQTSLWMFPVYALIPFVIILVTSLFSYYPIYIRGLIYLFSFYIIEFVVGILLKKFIGSCTWDYSRYHIHLLGREIKTNIQGIICLEAAVIWYIYGVLGEFYFAFLMRI